MMWELPEFTRFLERLAAMGRLILFDKRGTGLSDRVAGMPTLEQRADDIAAVMDAAGSARAAIAAWGEGAAIAAMFAAAHPERVAALVLGSVPVKMTDGPGRFLASGSCSPYRKPKLPGERSGVRSYSTRRAVQQRSRHAF